jgi:hypothetical protein
MNNEEEADPSCDCDKPSEYVPSPTTARTRSQPALIGSSNTEMATLLLPIDTEKGVVRQ